MFASLGELGALVPIFRHLHYCWCRGLANPCNWLLGWFADMVQRPATKSGVAVVADSLLEGAGKGIFVHWFGKHVGPRNDKWSRMDSEGDRTGHAACA